MGCPPLRVDRLGPALATHLLQRKPTFTDWVEAQRGENGAPLEKKVLRECMTIARSLALGTHEFGANYLVSSPAEVLIRRMFSLVLGARAGGKMAFAEILEELPGTSMVADLPDSIVEQLEKRMSVQAKLQKNMQQLYGQE